MLREDGSVIQLTPSRMNEYSSNSTVVVNMLRSLTAPATPTNQMIVPNTPKAPGRIPLRSRIIPNQQPIPSALLEEIDLLNTMGGKNLPAKELDEEAIYQIARRVVGKAFEYFKSAVSPQKDLDDTDDFPPRRLKMFLIFEICKVVDRQVNEGSYDNNEKTLESLALSKLSAAVERDRIQKKKNLGK